MRVLGIAAIAALGAFAMPAAAATVTEQLGDADGLDLGLASGDGFLWTDVASSGGESGTDVWRYGGTSIGLSYSLDGLGPITSASLEVGAGGLGYMGVASLYVDGVKVGDFTDGDDVGPDYNYYFVDAFDLSSVLASLDGDTTFMIKTAKSGDGWALDYMKLSIHTETAAVPLPASLALMLGGLGALGIARRRTV